MLQSISCLVVLISGFMGLTPDSDLQEIIKKFSGGASRIVAVEEFNVLMERLPDLEAAAGDDRVHLLQQIILVNYENRGTTGDPMIAAGIESIATFLDFNRSETLNAVLPMLEEAEDEKFRNFLNDSFLKLQEAIASSESTETSKHISIYDEILGDAFSGRREMPRGLILKLISDDPNKGLRTLIRNSDLSDEEKNEIRGKTDQIEALYIKKNINRNQDDLNSATEVIHDFSRSNFWWMRLYTAEILRKDPKLGTPEIIATLKRDRDKAVANRLSLE